MPAPDSLLFDAAANLGGHMRGKPNVLWRRPDPTARLLAASGLPPEALAPTMRRMRSKARRASAFEMAGFFVNLCALAGLCAYAYDAWPIAPAGYVALAVALLGTIHFGTQSRARTLSTRRTLGAGAPHPSEAYPDAIAVTPHRIFAAGRRGRPRELSHEHLHSVEILDRGEGDFLVRFWVRHKDGPSLFAEATRVPEASARSLVEAMRGRGARFEGEAARFMADLEARTVVLAPAVFDAARAAVADGRYPTLADAANAALESSLAA